MRTVGCERGGCLLVGEGEAELDDAKQVDVELERLGAPDAEALFAVRISRLRGSVLARADYNTLR